MKPATILYAHPSDELYGADRVILYLAQQLDKRLWRPIVVLSNDLPYEGQLSAALKDSGIPTVTLSMAVLRRKYFTPFGLLLLLWRLLRSSLELRRWIEKENVVLIHSSTAAVLSGFAAARMAGCPHIQHVQEILVKPRFMWRFLSWLSPRVSDRVVAASGPTRDHLVRGNAFNGRKSLTLHSGIDPTPYIEATGGPKLRSQWQRSGTEPLVGMIGRISSWKGQGYFLEVAKLVSTTHPNTRFVIVGGTIPGQENLLSEMLRKIDELDLMSNVVVSDFRTDIPDVLAALDIFVLPSILPDPFPTVLLEAMAAAKPIVANAHGGSVEAIEHEITGYLTAPNHSEEMADRIRHLLDHPEKAVAMGKAGRERQQREFSIEASARKWSDLYTQVLAERGIHLKREEPITARVR